MESTSGELNWFRSQYICDRKIGVNIEHAYNPLRSAKFASMFSDTTAYKIDKWQQIFFKRFRLDKRIFHRILKNWSNSILKMLIYLDDANYQCFSTFYRFELLLFFFSIPFSSFSLLFSIFSWSSFCWLWNYFPTPINGWYLNIIAFFLHSISFKWDKKWTYYWCSRVNFGQKLIQNPNKPCKSTIKIRKHVIYMLKNCWLPTRNANSQRNVQINSSFQILNN